MLSDLNTITERICDVPTSSPTFSPTPVPTNIGNCTSNNVCQCIGMYQLWPRSVEAYVPPNQEN